eukprot:3578284-Alexandrium_andersonii.AAC.1
MTLPELLRGAPARRQRILSDTQAKPPQDHALAHAVYAKTLEEVAEGVMAGPLPPDSVASRFGPHYNV